MRAQKKNEHDIYNVYALLHRSILKPKSHKLINNLFDRFRPTSGKNISIRVLIYTVYTYLQRGSPHLTSLINLTILTKFNSSTYTFAQTFSFGPNVIVYARHLTFTFRQNPNSQAGPVKSNLYVGRSYGSTGN